MCCSLKHTRLITICFVTLCALRGCRHVTCRNEQNLEKKEKKKRVHRDSHFCVPTYNGNSEYFLQETVSFKSNTSISFFFFHTAWIS